MTGNVTPAPGRPTAPTAPIPTGHGLLDIVLASLDDDQAQEVVSIDLKGKSSIADHMVIASGRSTRQVASMAQKLAEKIKHSGGRARVRSCRLQTDRTECFNLTPELLTPSATMGTHTF